MLGFLIVKENDGGIVGVRDTVEEATEYVKFLLITDPDPEAIFTIIKGIERV